MAKTLNINIGDKFNRLVLIELTDKKSNQNDFIGVWKCDCGIVKEIVNSKVRAGHTKSCGCYAKDMRHKAHYKHGYSLKHNETSEYKTWQKMKDRCTNINSPDYHHYGGRGIKVCDSWLEKFENFIQDMGNKPSINYSIERIDFNGNYEPINCKWILKTEQTKNKRNNIFVILDSKKLCLSEACRKLNINYIQTLYKYRKNKYLPENLKIYEEV